MQKTIKTASRRSKPPCSRRDEFLKRDRQLSLSGHPRQSKPGKLIAPSQTKRKRPRKDNAVHVSLPSDAIVKQRRLKDNQRKASPLIPGRSGRPRGGPPAKLDLNSKSSYPRLRAVETAENSPPPPLSREEYARQVPKPTAQAPERTAEPLEDADIGPTRISVNALSQRNSLLWISFPSPAFLHASSCPSAASALSAAAA